MEHIDALSQALDWRATPLQFPPTLNLGGDVQAVSAVHQGYTDSMLSDLTTWQGAAAEAYRTQVTNVGHLLDAAGMIVDAVRDKIGISAAISSPN